MTIRQRCYALEGGQKLSRATRFALFLATGILLLTNRSFAQLTVDRASGALTLSPTAAIKGYTISSPNGLLSPEAWSSLADQEVEGWFEANPLNEFLSELNPFGSIATPLNLGNGYAGTTVVPAQEDVAVEYIMDDGTVVDGDVTYVGPINDFVLNVDPASGAAALWSLSGNVGSFDVTGFTISSASGSLNVDGFTGLPGDAWTKAGLSANTLSQISFDSSQLFDKVAVGIGNVFTTGAEQDLKLEYGVVGESKARIGTVAYGVGDGGPVEPTCEEIAATRLPGDANANDEVEFLDFLVLSNNFGLPGGYNEGDFNCSGEVEFLDFLILSNNFGSTGPAAAAGTAAVPEPASGPLAIFAALLFAGIFRKRVSSAVCMCLIGMTVFVSVGADSAMAQEFSTRMIVLDAENPGANNQINTALEARGMLNGSITDANFSEDVTGTVEFIDFAGGGGAYSNFDNPYPNGVNDESLNDFAVQVTGFLEIPEGTWYIGLNSDDGGYITMPRVNFTNTVNENGATGAVGELMYNGTRGQGTFTYGEFTVPAGGVRTEFEALMFERGGGDAFEVAVLDDEFPIEQNSDWADFGIELGEGTYDWKLIETGPAEGDFNWDDAVNFDDFLVMAANFNTGTSFAQGDFNGDGAVNLVDFGAFYPLLTPPAAAASSVPEPASVSLLALGLVTLLSIRRRQNR